MATSIAFLLFDGFSNMVLSCLLEPLRAVRDQAQADIRWQVLTPGNRPARSSSGLTIAPDGRAEAPGPVDILVIVSGYGFRDHAVPANLRLISGLARLAPVVICADAGAWLAAAAGLLHERRATAHWAMLAEFAEAFPDTTLSTDRYVMEGRIWSCGGASSALDLILAVISDRFGPANAFLASMMFVHDSGAPRRLEGKGTEKLRQIVNLMVETIEHPLPLPQIAAQAGVSCSKLDRLFRSELGQSPGRYYQLLRLSRARDLATGSSFDLREIALRCGYSDAAALAKAFRHAYGHSIRKSRGARPRQI
ncbi:GlxA family transcriptional regulator [Paenirhodobacter sp.]|uniref:GlxA family transcriptional regulator n=1 Tax=Paenirhodobacter sp. TaxID=1965326 RepID=UPI003B40744F